MTCRNGSPKGPSKLTASFLIFLILNFKFIVSNFSFHSFEFISHVKTTFQCRVHCSRTFKITKNRHQKFQNFLKTKHNLGDLVCISLSEYSGHRKLGHQILRSDRQWSRKYENTETRTKYGKWHRPISWKLIQIWTSEIGLAHAPIFYKNWIGTQKKLVDEFSRNWSSSFPGNLNFWKISGWVFQDLPISRLNSRNRKGQDFFMLAVLTFLKKQQLIQWIMLIPGISFFGSIPWDFDFEILGWNFGIAWVVPICVVVSFPKSTNEYIFNNFGNKG